MADCNDPKKNLGLTKCSMIPQLPKGMITTPLGWSIPKATLDAGEDAVLAYILAAMKAPIDQRVYFWPDFVNYEDISDASVYEENILSDLFIFNGKNKFNAMFNVALCVHRAMMTHNGGNQGVILIDIKNQLNGTSNSDGDFLGYTVSLLNVEKLKRGDGQAATKSVVRVVLKDSNEVDENGALIESDFINDLASKKLTDVKLTIATPAADASNIYFTVENACDGESVSGFAKEDFRLRKTSDGSYVAVAGLTYDATTGIYHATSAAAFVDGVFDLKDPASLSLDSYESTGGLLINV